MSTSSHVQSPLMRVSRGPVHRASPVWYVLAVILGGVFIYAGVTKVVNPLAFANDISHFHVLNWPLGIRLAFYLPWLEILCGLALIAGPLRTGALGLLTAMTSVFIVVSIAARARGIDLNCGCFGSAGKGLSFTWHMIIDFAILAGFVALWFSPLVRATARRN